MGKAVKNLNKDFEQVLFLIQEARNRTFSKVNAELVSLYFDVGGIVSRKVEEGNWGENTVEDLANYIATNLPAMQGFNRRGLYRMKQFYETYTSPQFVTTLLSHLQIEKNGVSKFVTTLLSQIQWSAHLHIFPPLLVFFTNKPQCRVHPWHQVVSLLPLLQGYHPYITPAQSPRGLLLLS